MDTLKMSSPSSAARTGVWIGIATITMSFTAYTSAMVVRQGSGADWRHLTLPPILYLDTLLLLASSGTLEAGRRRLQAGWARPATDAPATGVRRPAGVAWLAGTMGLGLLFVAGQLMAWRQLAARGLYLASNPASDFFYLFTALHGLHLLGGIAAMAYLLGRLRAATGDAPRAVLGAVSLYWHFMGLLWLYLLLILATRL